MHKNESPKSVMLTVTSCQLRSLLLMVKTVEQSWMLWKNTKLPFNWECFVPQTCSIMLTVCICIVYLFYRILYKVLLLLIFTILHTEAAAEWKPWISDFSCSENKITFISACNSNHFWHLTGFWNIFIRLKGWGVSLNWSPLELQGFQLSLSEFRNTLQFKSNVVK